MKFVCKTQKSCIWIYEAVTAQCVDLFLPSWEQEQSKHRRKWQAERKKESLKKEESEKDSDSPESPPDSTESQEVRLARENLVTLTAEQKKVQSQKVRAADLLS